MSFVRWGIKRGFIVIHLPPLPSSKEINARCFVQQEMVVTSGSQNQAYGNGWKSTATQGWRWNTIIFIFPLSPILITWCQLELNCFVDKWCYTCS